MRLKPTSNHEPTATSHKPPVSVQPPEIARKAEQLGMRDWSLWRVYDEAASGLRNYWYPVGWSNRIVEEKPYPIKLCGERIVQMRDSGRIHAMDRCGREVPPLHEVASDHHAACFLHDSPDTPVQLR